MDRLTFKPDKKTFDELVVNQCDLVHLKRMDDDTIWVGVHKNGDMVFHAYIVWDVKKGLRVIINEDGINQ